MPRRNLQIARRRVAFFLGLFAVATIVALSGAGIWEPPARLALSDPGRLSGAHARFTEVTGCQTCHTIHEGGVQAWIGAAFSAQDLSGTCLTCHAFEGPADRPHNAVMTPLRGPAKTTCVGCHTEHQGQGFDIAVLSDARCNVCHRSENRFTSFAKDHPSFGANYPHETPAAVKFNHISHLSKYFASKGDTRQASQTCLSCHDIARAGSDVPVVSFERMCADCHADEIGRKELVLLTLPEFEEDLLSLTVKEEEAIASGATDQRPVPEEILEACGTGFAALESVGTLLAAKRAGEETDAEGAEDFLSIGDEEPTPLDAFLLAIDPEDIEEYWPRYRDLLRMMSQNGVKTLENLVDARFGQGSSKALLAGLTSLSLEEVACAWAANEEYDAPNDVSGAGWIAEELRISYNPAGHADPVLRSWLEAVVALADGGEFATEPAVALSDFMLSEEDGPGTCAFCHAATQDAGADIRDANGTAASAETTPISFGWVPRQSMRWHVAYAHGPHINLMGPGTQCTSCHRLEPATAVAEADSDEGGNEEQARVSLGGFAPIVVDTCKGCHRANGIRQNCQTCHRYHRGAAFRKGML